MPRTNCIGYYSHANNINAAVIIALYRAPMMYELNIRERAFYYVGGRT